MLQANADPRLPTIALAAAMSALRSVCGIDQVSVIASSSKAARTRETTYTASFTGWSPSLHRTRCYLHVNADHRDPDFAEVLANTFTAALASQRRRLEAGIALGIVEPLPVLLDSADEVETGHLLVDRALPGIAAANGADACSELFEVLIDAHGGDNDHDGGAAIETEAGIVTETPFGRIVGFVVDMGETADGHEVSFDGMTLDISGLTLPHTAMTGMTGRPLREVAIVHPMLDDRLIVAMEAGAGGGSPLTRIALELDLVPYDSIT